MFGMFGADERIDHDRAIGIEFADQRLVAGASELTFVFGGVTAEEIPVAEQYDGAAGDHDQGERTGE
jgi:hypothetical protein